MKGRLSSRVHIEAQKGGDKHTFNKHSVSRVDKLCSIELVVCTAGNSLLRQCLKSKSKKSAIKSSAYAKLFQALCSNAALIFMNQPSGVV